MEKEYTGTIRFGFATDTYDCDGESVSELQTVELEQSWLSAAVEGMRGDIEQKPPLYSAKKVKGVPAHRLARRGEAPDLQAVTIHVAKFEAWVESADTVGFAAAVSAGGYIRCLAHDLGQQLGCGAHLTALRRVRAGDFMIAQAVTLEALAEHADDGRRKRLLPSSQILPHLPSVTVDEGMATRIRNGAQVNLPEFSRAEIIRISGTDGVIVAIARRLAGTLFAPQTVLA
jgi:tRNA pseudouridine55 synthase